MIVYIDSESFSTATTVYLDSLLSEIAPDGYYSDNVDYRRQVDGKLTDIVECPVITSYCVNWTAENNANIKMSTQGYIDFTGILAGRTIAIASCEGNITEYTIPGVPTPYTCSIPMDFTTSQAQWDTDLLPAVTDTVLNSLKYTVYVEFTDSSYYEIINEQTYGTVTPGGLTSEYNDCI